MSAKDLPLDYRRSPSPGGSFPSPPVIHSDKNMCHLENTPVRKNKRKRSEPKKRTDFSIKRFCPESPSPGSACSESGVSEDTDNNHEDSPDSPQECPRGVILPERVDSSEGHQSDSNSNGSPPVHPGIMLFPGHVPPGYLIPNFHYRHPGLPFPTQSHLSGRISGMDFINATASRTNNYQGVNLSNKNNSQVNVEACVENSTSSVLGDQELEDDYCTENGSRNDNKKSRKNYKNMTRERRIEANARERTRVHTISAAFESLRRAVPSYSYNQKLSKLAILRIASSYIMALGRLAEIDNFDNKETRGSFGDCVDMCTRTIQTEGRARRRH